MVEVFTLGYCCLYPSHSQCHSKRDRATEVVIEFMACPLAVVENGSDGAGEIEAGMSKFGLAAADNDP